MLNWNEVFSKDAYEFNFIDVDTKVTPEFARNLRLKLKLSQKMFAKILGISHKTIEKWEKGDNPIQGTASRMLYLLNKHEDLLNDLYLVKREDQEICYYQAYHVKAIPKPKNAKKEKSEIKFMPIKPEIRKSLIIKNPVNKQDQHEILANI